MIVRPERADDAAAVYSLLIAAFGREVETDLVRRLRRDGDFIFSLVADDGRVRGYAGFARLQVESGQDNREVAGLAPIAVMPAQQRRGIGSELIREGHRGLAERAVPLVFVLGDPAYYARFGYSVAAAQPFGSAYAGPNFMAVRLSADAPQSGNIRYPAAFERLL